MEAAELLAPRQLGLGIQGGMEAAVHAARLFISNFPTDHALIKLDFSNAFNSIKDASLSRHSVARDIPICPFLLL